MMTACVLEMLDEEEQGKLRGRMLGAKNIRRTRKSVEDMWSELGSYARKAYRMSLDAFYLLHDTLEDALKEEFNSGPRARGASPNGDIPTKLRLSAALRFFAGGSVYDIMLTHGMGKVSVYKSIYGVVDCVNKDKSLAFNLNDAEFPSHEEQAEIASGFHAKSGAGFDKIVMALDGMLVWTNQRRGRTVSTSKLENGCFIATERISLDMFSWPAVIMSANFGGRILGTRAARRTI